MLVGYIIKILAVMKYDSKNGPKRKTFECGDKVAIALIWSVTVITVLILCKILAVDFGIMVGMLSFGKLWQTLSK